MTYADQIRTASDQSTNATVQGFVDTATAPFREDLNVANEQLELANAEIATLTEKLEDADADLDSLSAELAVANAKIADLEAEIERLEEEQQPEVPVFEVGITYPDETTVGAGIIRAYPTKVVTEYTEFNGPATEVVKDTVFENYVDVNGTDWVFENCVFRGTSAFDKRANIVDTTQSTGTIFRYCDISPMTADSHFQCVGYKNYTLEQCHVWGGTDNFAAFALKTDPDPAVHIKIIGTWAEKLTQFKPDTAVSRPVTHNDIIQLQGNVGPVDDVLIDGCRFDAYHSKEQGTPQPPEHTQISAIMLSPNTQDQVNITVQRSWFTGGIFTLNASAPTLTKSTIVITNNIWEKPSKGKVAAALAIDLTLTKRTITGNVYLDGTPVPIYNA